MRRLIVLLSLVMLPVGFAGCCGGSSCAFDTPQSLVDAFVQFVNSGGHSVDIKTFCVIETTNDEIIKLIRAGLKLEGPYTITGNEVTWKNVWHTGDGKEYTFALIIGQDKNGCWEITGFGTEEVVQPVDEIPVEPAPAAPVK